MADNFPIQAIDQRIEPWHVGAKRSAKEFFAQWFWFAAGISPDRVGFGSGPLTWLRSARHALARRDIHLCLLTCGRDRVGVAELTARAINERSRSCSASVDVGLGSADVVWICEQDPIPPEELDRLSELIRTRAKSDVKVINPPSSYNGYHVEGTFDRLASHGVSVPRCSFTSEDVGATRVIYKKLGCQAAPKRNIIYRGDLPGTAAFEFIDSRDPDGLHRRYRAHYFLGLVRPSEVFLSDHWNVCWRNALQVQYGFDLSSEDAAQIRRIAEALKLDFFAVDFIRRTSDGRAFFTDINVYPAIRSPQQLVRRRGDLGQWHTFDACSRLGAGEPLGGSFWDHFDEAVLKFTRTEKMISAPSALMRAARLRRQPVARAAFACGQRGAVSLKPAEDIYRSAGPSADHSVVLRGNAVNYAVSGLGALGLAIGAWKQTEARRMDHDLIDLIENRKIPVFVIEEDLAERGIDRDELVPGVLLLSGKKLPKQVAEHDLILHW